MPDDRPTIPPLAPSYRRRMPSVRQDDPEGVRAQDKVAQQRDELFLEVQALERELMAKSQRNARVERDRVVSESIPPERRKLTLAGHIIAQFKQRFVSIVLGGALGAGGGVAERQLNPAPRQADVAELKLDLAARTTESRQARSCQRDWAAWSEDMAAYNLELWEKVGKTKIRGRDEYPSRNLQVVPSLEVNGVRTYDVTSTPPPRPNCR